MPTDPAAESRTDTRPDAAALRRLRARLGRSGSPPWLHTEVARRMADKLHAFVRAPQVVMDWGGQLGGGRSAWSGHYPQARQVLVEADAAALEAVRRELRGPWWRLGRSTRAELLLEADLAQQPHRADLLWSNMGLHFAPDVPSLLRRWQQVLAPEGLLLFSTIGPDTGRELAALYRRLGWGPAAWPSSDMHDLGDELVRAGFADPVVDMERITLTWTDAAAMLAELRGLGGNAHPLRFAGLRTPRWKQQLLEECAAHECRRNDGRLGLTFEIVYGHAVKGLAVANEGRVQVPLGDLRAQLPSVKRKP